MRAGTGIRMLAGVVCLAACSLAGAQAVYKCGSRSYSYQPCSRHTVNTAEAPVPQQDAKQRAADQRRLLAQSLRRKPGESSGACRNRRWARLLPTDGQECARLEARMPVETMRLVSADKAEVESAQAALAGARKRSLQLHC